MQYAWKAGVVVGPRVDAPHGIRVIGRGIEGPTAIRQDGAARAVAQPLEREPLAFARNRGRAHHRAVVLGRDARRRPALRLHRFLRRSAGWRLRGASARRRERTSPRGAGRHRAGGCGQPDRTVHAVRRSGWSGLRRFDTGAARVHAGGEDRRRAEETPRVAEHSVPVGPSSRGPARPTTLALTHRVALCQWQVVAK